MNIGIITFHWATNYGAILQTYALQTFLQSLGHQVQVINYKPASHEFNVVNLLKNPKGLLHINKYIQKKRKESLLAPFREHFLLLSEKFSNQDSLEKLASQYDVIISGSDQVLNPSFTLYGDRKHPTSAYYLSFASPSTRKVAYAVSFGCNIYPDNASKYAKEWIKSFDCIGVREKSGIAIVEALGYRKPAVIVPDPVVLCGKKVFDRITKPTMVRKSYVCVYSLRRELPLPKGYNYCVIDDVHSPVSMEEWISSIIGGDFLITNSFHGMVVALLNHIPFAIEIVGDRGMGMNDRFYTLLERLELKNRICGVQFSLAELLNNHSIDWHNVDLALNKIQKEGADYLNEALCS